MKFHKLALLLIALIALLIVFIGVIFTLGYFRCQDVLNDPQVVKPAVIGYCTGADAYFREGFNILGL